MNNMQILDLAGKTLDQGLYFGKGRITRAIDSEIIAFAKQVELDATKRIVEFVRNNYQDHANIASLCDAMLAAREVKS